LSLTAIIVTYILLFNTEIFIAFIKKSTDPNGRIPAYEHAIKIFLEYPIFGVGVGHGMIAVNSCGNFYGLFHSTLFHTLATTGIVGLIAFAVYYVERLKLITKNRTTLGFYALVSFIAFALYGIVDNSEFNIVLVYMTAIIAITGLENKKNDDQPLPLTHMRRNIFTINKKEK
jgi:O-antigen ligase